MAAVLRLTYSHGKSCGPGGFYDKVGCPAICLGDLPAVLRLFDPGIAFRVGILVLFQFIHIFLQRRLFSVYGLGKVVVMHNVFLLRENLAVPSEQ